MDLQEALQWAFEQGQTQTVVTADGPVLVAKKPDGTIVLTTTEHQENEPRRTRVHEKFTDVASFASYIKRFDAAPDLDPVYIGSLSGKSVVGTLDYDSATATSWRTHKAELVSVQTPEWKAFVKVNQKWFAQQEFAEFLEEWNHVVIEPEAAALSEIAMNLEGSVGGKFASKINRTNGNVVIRFEEETSTGQIVVPSKIMVALRPFYYSPLVDVLILLRFRVEGAAPKFQLVIQNCEKIEYDALTSMFAEVSKVIGSPVLIGP